MPRLSLFRTAFPGFLLLIGSAALACGDPFAGVATIENKVDTVTLYALNGTPIRLPSAYDVLTESPVRTDVTSAFDFAFDIDAGGKARILPAGVLGGSREPGIRRVDDAFEQVKSAPLDGYVFDSALTVQQAGVFVVRSRAAPGCIFLGALPRYGKFRVLGINGSDRSIVLETLVNLNCGFRGLEPGLPTS